MKKFIYILILLAVVFGIYKLVHHKTKAVPVSNNPADQSNLENSKAENLQPAINGVLVPAEVAEKRPIAVMVENHPDARPQSGLVDADLVYEAIAEGGITRFMAVYQTKSSNNIGPIRSARVYYATLADELGAVYAHVGGNSDALANIKAGLYNRIADADQFFLDNYFHRIKSRLMPHNVYTSLAKLQQFVNDRKLPDTATYQAWQFKDDAPATSSPAKIINVDFSESDFAVKWKYESSNNSYLRFMAGSAHKDLDSGPFDSAQGRPEPGRTGGKQITAKNIIVQFVTGHSTVTDTIGSQDFDLVGQGKAKVFLDGKEIDATWKKQNSGRTRYYDLLGNEIRFNRGSTWVEIVPADKQISWS